MRPDSGTAAAARRLAVLAVFGISAMGCGVLPSGPDSRQMVTRLHVRGTVVSEVDGAPIQGADVQLGAGGSFSLPQVFTEAVTDADGDFEVEHSLSHRGSICGAWLAVSAEGFVPRVDPASTVIYLDCVSETQTGVIELAPL